MNHWEVVYGGLWLGGTAIVFAETAEEAADLVRVDPRTNNFTSAITTPITVPAPCVLYNDNGDY